MSFSNLHALIKISLTGFMSFLMILVLAGCDSDNDVTGVNDEFTGNFIVYDLDSSNEDNISGTVLFEEKTDGSTLVTIELDGTADGESYEAHIHENSVAEGGPIAVPLANVDGTTGVSETEMEASQLTYEALLNYDGHVNVHDPDDLAIIVAQGNIGANENGDSGNGNGNDNGDY